MTSRIYIYIGENMSHSLAKCIEDAERMYRECQRTPLFSYQVIRPTICDQVLKKCITAHGAAAFDTTYSASTAHGATTFGMSNPNQPNQPNLQTYQKN